MITISDVALKKITELIENTEQPVQGIRIIAEAISEPIISWPARLIGLAIS